MTILALYYAWRRFCARILYWRCAQFARKFRERHPDLIELEREMKRDGETLRLDIARQMAKRDNKKAREEMPQGEVLRFDAWDYVVPRNDFEMRHVLDRIKLRKLCLRN